MLPDNKKIIIKMMRLEDIPASEDGKVDIVPAHKQIPKDLVALVEGMEIAMANCSNQRGVKWETLSVLVAQFIVKDMADDKKSEGGSVGVKRNTPLVLKRGKQKLKGSFIAKVGDMYSIQLDKDDDPIEVDPSKVEIKG